MPKSKEADAQATEGGMKAHRKEDRQKGEKVRSWQG